VAPIGEHEAEEARRIAPEIHRQRLERDGVEYRLKYLQEKAAKMDAAADAAQVRDEASKLQETIRTTRIPRPPRLIADDVTSEKLSSLLVEQGGRIAILASEAGRRESRLELYDFCGGCHRVAHLRERRGKERVMRVVGPRVIRAKASVTSANFSAQ
jgi:hypothetical protein